MPHLSPVPPTPTAGRSAVPVPASARVTALVALIPAVALATVVATGPSAGTAGAAPDAAPSASSAVAPGPPAVGRATHETAGPLPETEAVPDLRPAAEPAAAVAYEAPGGDTVTAERLRGHLDKVGSPLAAHADELVDAGVRHGVDPRIVVAISAIESGYGQRLPGGSHNAWGWSGSGPHGLKAWPDWNAAIDDYTERLGRLYPAADVADVGPQFAATYCPPNAEHWLSPVRAVLAAI